MTPKSDSCAIDIPTDTLSVTLDPESIAGDDAQSPYWNGRCAEMQSKWWLPHRTMSPGQSACPPEMSSNFKEEASDFWKRTILPTGPASAAALRVSLPAGTPVTASVLVKATRKIRACPKNPDLLHELVCQQRRACNLAVACFREADAGLVDPKGPDLKQTALRATIRDFVRSEVEERGGTFRSADCDEAVNAAFRARDAVIRRRSRGERCRPSFRSISDIRQRIAVQKLSGAFVARNFDLAEPMPDEAWKKLTTIVLAQNADIGIRPRTEGSRVASCLLCARRAGAGRSCGRCTGACYGSGRAGIRARRSLRGRARRTLLPYAPGADAVLRGLLCVGSLAATNRDINATELARHPTLAAASKSNDTDNCRKPRRQFGMYKRPLLGIQVLVTQKHAGFIREGLEYEPVKSTCTVPISSSGWPKCWPHAIAVTCVQYSSSVRTDSAKALTSAIVAGVPSSFAEPPKSLLE